MGLTHSREDIHVDEGEQLLKLYYEESQTKTDQEICRDILNEIIQHIQNPEEKRVSWEDILQLIPEFEQSILLSGRLLDLLRMFIFLHENNNLYGDAITYFQQCFQTDLDTYVRPYYPDQDFSIFNDYVPSTTDAHFYMLDLHYHILTCHTFLAMLRASTNLEECWELYLDNLASREKVLVEMNVVSMMDAIDFETYKRWLSQKNDILFCPGRKDINHVQVQK